MKRRRPTTGRVVRALLLGLVLTVLLGWSAMFLPWGTHGYGPPATDDLGLVKTSDGKRIWQLSEGRNAWHHVISYWHMQISGMSMMIPIKDYDARKYDLDELPAHLRPDSVDDLKIWAEYSEVGWPLKALTCSIHWDTQISNENVIYTVRNGFNLGRDAKYDPLALPLVPVLPGFLLDVLCWAVAWYFLEWSLLGWSLRALRHWRSRRRNVCVHCGYSREGMRPNSICPECGKPNVLE